MATAEWSYTKINENGIAASAAKEKKNRKRSWSLIRSIPLCCCSGIIFGTSFSPSTSIQLPTVAAWTTPTTTTPMRIPKHQKRQVTESQLSSSVTGEATIEVEPYTFLPQRQPFQPYRIDSAIVSAYRKGMDRNVSSIEKTAMSVTGTVLTLGILYTLAMNDVVVGTTGSGSATFEALETAGMNIVDAAIPLTASDVVSVAAGEAIAGIVGAATSFGIARTNPLFIQKPPQAAVTSVSSSASTIVPSLSSAVSSSLSGVSSSDTDVAEAPPSTSNYVVGGLKASDAVADGDFLLTSAAAKPLLRAAGVPPFLATLAATVLAIVPYAAVKVNARRRELVIQEAALMDQLLADEQERTRRRNVQFGPWSSIATELSRSITTSTSVTVDPKQLYPVTNSKPKLDLVEVFADLAKWLSFDVLRSDFGGHLMWQNGEPMYPGIESAIIGCIIGLATQVYADALYAYFGLGGETMRTMVQTRTVQGTAAMYLSKMVYCAILFGVYDAVQIPAQAAIAALSSGGIDACVGSNEYASCIATFVTNNPPPEASPEAELRSLATAIVSLWTNYGVPSWTVRL